MEDEEKKCKNQMVGEYQEDEAPSINWTKLIWPHRDWSCNHRLQGQTLCICSNSFQFSICVELLHVWTESVSDSPALSWVFFFFPFFLSVGFLCPTLMWLFLFCLVMFCSVLFSCYLLEAYSFLMRQKGTRSGWERRQKELGGVWVGEAVIKIYCIREESIFNKRGKKDI